MLDYNSKDQYEISPGRISELIFRNNIIGEKLSHLNERKASTKEPRVISINMYSNENLKPIKSRNYDDRSEMSLEEVKILPEN